MRNRLLDSKLPSKQGRYRRGNDDESNSDNEPISAGFYRRTAGFALSHYIRQEQRGERGWLLAVWFTIRPRPAFDVQGNFVKFLFFFFLLFLSLFLVEKFATRFCPRFCPRIQFYGRGSSLACSRPTLVLCALPLARARAQLLLISSSVADTRVAIFALSRLLLVGSLYARTSRTSGTVRTILHKPHI